MVDTEVFDHGLLTQFVNRFLTKNKRDAFEVVWEKSTVDAPAPASVSTALTGGAPIPSRQGKDTPSLKNVKTNIEENSKNFQSQDDGGRKGAHLPLQNMEAMVVLFKGKADASTLVHEIAHYAFET